VSLGVSNCSYGLKPDARRVLNSVMLHHCIEAGLDAAIVNARKVLPLASIPEQLRERASDLVFNRPAGGRDPLEAFIECFENGVVPGADETVRTEATVSPVARCRRAVIRGERTGLEDTISALLAEMGPVEIINGILLDAMREVGVMFGRGEMQLPFVLRSAAVMKAAVDILEPAMQKNQSAPRGTLVLATVVGDVHDIGKNLVDIIVSNNGYRVVNLGIKQTVDAIMQAAISEKADAIGMSGLLVKSTIAMRDNLVAMNRAGLSIPVLVGGAALDRGFVENELAPVYGGPVIYCRDAFDGLNALDRLVLS
jgi:5-methyltetrahydrofolate--homocysteine methyltransferase